MSGRTIILILFFWAVLSIVTPVLVRLSATAKANGEFFVKHTSDLKEKTNAGKVIGLLPRRALVAVAPPLAPVPGPSPWPTDTRTTRVRTAFWFKKLSPLFQVVKTSPTWALRQGGPYIIVAGVGWTVNAATIPLIKVQKQLVKTFSPFVQLLFHLNFLFLVIIMAMGIDDFENEAPLSFML
ncbi:hypothetical protein RND71_016501 [Anisodus tanguticus]|uniref:Transmembrane protein n=1 Tax=Anisodus tanguticus TaxID=243964 RepID=A0AAE1S7C8_9SOLA|nr:hypothetical protein RND71_016501 [Anisodus tanguticus]